MATAEINDLSLPEAYDTLCPQESVRTLLEAARREDLGDVGDVTSLACIPADASARAQMVARRPGRVAGLRMLPMIARVFAPEVTVEMKVADGDVCAAGQPIAAFEGPMRGILTLERTALNLVGRLCGVATLTAEYVSRVTGTNARVYDTRKTTPGLRGPEKYAVRCGGGSTHRLGLHDALLIKDNHIAGVADDDLASFVAETARRAREIVGLNGLLFVEIEVDRLDQLAALLERGRAPDGAYAFDTVLLDNMTPEQLQRAIAMRDQAGAAAHIQFEASGGINLDTVGAIAATGVERISVGGLTHAPASLDVGLDIE